jgi:hypothetical protein
MSAPKAHRLRLVAPLRSPSPGTRRRRFTRNTTHLASMFITADPPFSHRHTSAVILSIWWLQSAPLRMTRNVAATEVNSGHCAIKSDYTPQHAHKYEEEEEKKAKLRGGLARPERNIRARMINKMISHKEVPVYLDGTTRGDCGYHVSAGWPTAATTSVTTRPLNLGVLIESNYSENVWTWKFQS